MKLINIILCSLILLNLLSCRRDDKPKPSNDNKQSISNLKNLESPPVDQKDEKIDNAFLISCTEEELRKEFGKPDDVVKKKTYSGLDSEMESNFFKFLETIPQASQNILRLNDLKYILGLRFYINELPIFLNFEVYKIGEHVVVGGYIYKKAYCKDGKVKMYEIPYLGTRKDLVVKYGEPQEFKQIMSDPILVFPKSSGRVVYLSYSRSLVYVSNDFINDIQETLDSLRTEFESKLKDRNEQQKESLR